MEAVIPKSALVQQLQKDILSLQGSSPAPGKRQVRTGMDAVENAFPGRAFPTGTIQEFVNLTPGDAAATNGFIAGLLAAFMQAPGRCLWISARRTLFPRRSRLLALRPSASYSLIPYARGKRSG